MNTIDEEIDHLWREAPDWHHYNLKSFEHYLKITKLADADAKQKTWIYRGTLKEIWSNLFGFQEDGIRANIHGSIVGIINELFSKSNKVWSNEDWLTTEHSRDDLLTKPNAFFHILEELRSGQRIYDPINLVWFPDWFMPGIVKQQQPIRPVTNFQPRFETGIARTRWLAELSNMQYVCFSDFTSAGRWQLHPGNTRMQLANVYNGQVNCIITDYSNGYIKQFYPMIDEINLHDFNVTGRRLSLGWTGAGGYCPRSVTKTISPKNTIAKYREVQGSAITINLAKPTTYMPPRCFEKIGNEVKVNGSTVLRNNNGLWELVL